MTRIGLLILIFATVLRAPPAEASKTRVFEFEGKPITLQWHTDHEGWLSAECSSKKGCEALRILSVLRQTRISLGEPDLAGGKNPGSVLCSKLSATVVFGQAQDGGGRMSFCKAGDGSLVPSSVLDRAWNGGSR